MNMMEKPTYEEQNAWLSKYVAPVFIDLNFRPIFDATVKPLWERYVTIPREVKANRTPEAREEMRAAGVYDALQNLELENALGNKFQRILMGDVPENEKCRALLSNLSEYVDGEGKPNIRQFSSDIMSLSFELKKKPLEVLEARIQTEIPKYLKDFARNFAEDVENGYSIGRNCVTVEIMRKMLIEQLLRDYDRRVKPQDREPLFKAHMEFFRVGGEYNISREI